mmetsp:Transcript_116878/g.337739  ORF Transcript_116878/g.337739 Transcript_116878/m.337739 type:complete len:195 (+) Transcript_116878:2149-2733(+)
MFAFRNLVHVVLDDTDLQRAATQVVKQVNLWLLVRFVHSKVESRSRIFFNQTQHIEIRQGSSIQVSLTLRLSGKGRNGQNTVSDTGEFISLFLAVGDGHFLGMAKKHRNQFLWSVRLLSIHHQIKSISGFIELWSQRKMSFSQNLDCGVVIVSSKHNRHRTRCFRGLSGQQTARIGSVESSALVKQNHLLCLSL